jgi:hypothetical protein
MKKRLLTVVVVLLLLSLVFALIHEIWRAMAWKQAALSKAERIGYLMAAGDYAKGKRVQYRLAIRDLDNWRPVDGPTEWDGPYVIREWLCFVLPACHPPLLFCCRDHIFMSGGTNSPHVQLANKSVEAYNRRMRDICENPERHRKLILRSLHYWETNVLGKTEVSTNTVQEYFRRASGGPSED